MMVCFLKIIYVIQQYGLANIHFKKENTLRSNIELNKILPVQYWTMNVITE